MRLLGKAFSRLKLKHKIFAGFTTIGAIAVAIALVSVITINNLYGDFQRFTDFADQVETGRELSSQMIELQRLSEQYIREGEGFTADRAERAFARARRLLSRLEQGQGEGLSHRTEGIRVHLDGFQEAFAEVKRQRDRQSRLVNQTLPEHAEQCQSLVFYFQDHLPAHHPGLVAPAERLENALLQVERNSYRYFDQFDSSLVRRIEKDMDHARSLMATLRQAEDHDTHTALLARIDTSMDDYQNLILEAVQRTRGYLYLVNVVMAAETYEILYQSDRLSEDMKAEMERIEGRMADTIREAGTSALLVSVFILLMIGVLSYLIGRSIANPIEDMTLTFRKLARGEPEGPLRNYGSNDELGELAQAARVFGDRNRETQRLLAQYQDISEALEQRVEARTRELAEANRQLETLSQTDGLTGLANRRYFAEVMAREWATARRSSLSLAVIMLDVDLFKPFNDLYGHQAGDDCLKAVARALQENLPRQTDLPARYGGEEFIVILQDTDTSAASGMAETLRGAIAGMAIPHRGSPFEVVTASFGVAVYEPGADLDSDQALIGLADDALYQSKQAGRNRVTCRTASGASCNPQPPSD